MRGFVILLVTVLGAIGIGVGAVAAAGPVTYGPPGAGFRLAFTVPVAHGSVRTPAAVGDAYIGRSPDVEEVAFVVASRHGSLTSSSFNQVMTALRALPALSAAGSLRPNAGPMRPMPGCATHTSTLARPAGAMAFFEQVSPGLCEGLVRVNRQDAIWEAGAIARSAATVHAFVESLVLTRP